jgi:hypothetical protein
VFELGAQKLTLIYVFESESSPIDSHKRDAKALYVTHAAGAAALAIKELSSKVESIHKRS